MNGIILLPPRRRFIPAVVLGVICVLVLSGCQSAPTGADRPWAAGASPFETGRLVGRSLQGRPIEAHVLGTGGDVTLVLGTIHGDEPAGTPLALSLIEHLKAHPERLRDRRVVIVPVANPDGLAAGTRSNANGVDLNRNFPAENRRDERRYGDAGLSEPESRAIHRLLHDYEPDRVIAVHQPLNCVDYDGPGKALAERMAALCGLPVKKLGARPGSLGAYAGEDLGIPTITLELPEGEERLGAEELWRRYGPALMAAIDPADGAEAVVRER